MKRWAARQLRITAAWSIDDPEPRIIVLPLTNLQINPTSDTITPTVGVSSDRTGEFGTTEAQTATKGAAWELKFTSDEEDRRTEHTREGLSDGESELYYDEAELQYCDSRQTSSDELLYHDPHDIVVENKDKCPHENTTPKRKR